MLLGAGLLMIFAGFALVFVGAASQENASSGGVVFIGPFPIVFGTGPGGGELALLSVVIGAVMVALLILWSWRLSHPVGGGNKGRGREQVADDNQERNRINMDTEAKADA